MLYNVLDTFFCSKRRQKVAQIFKILKMVAGSVKKDPVLIKI